MEAIVRPVTAVNHRGTHASFERHASRELQTQRLEREREREGERENADSAKQGRREKHEKQGI